MTLDEGNIGRVDRPVRVDIALEVGGINRLAKLRLAQRNVGRVDRAVPVVVPNQEAHREIEVDRRSISCPIHSEDPNIDYLRVGYVC